MAFDQLFPLNRSEVLLAQLYTFMVNALAHPKPPLDVRDVLLTPAMKQLEEASVIGQEWAQTLAEMRANSKSRKPN